MRRRISRVALAGIAAASITLAPLTLAPASAAEVTTTIADVQGTGAASPLVGQTVTVEGVVTGYYDAVSGYKGLYLQTQGSGGATDATPGASDGVFVYFNAAAPAVAIGDLITVTGAVSEFQGLTEISATTAAAYTVVQAGAGLPEATPLPDTVLGADREAYEGMLVQPSGTYVLSSSHQLYNFGSLWLSAGAESVQATEAYDAGTPEAIALAAANVAKRLLVDDGYSIQVINNAHPGTQPYFTSGTVVRNGDVLVPPAKPMILSFGFADWRLQPQIPLNDASPAEYKPGFTATNPRPAAPPAVGGDLKIASFNVENYFTDFGGDARGAENAEELAVQEGKVVSAINALDANILTLEEIENSAKFGHPVDETLAHLVGALNADAGAGTWDYVRTPDALADPTTTDFIKNAIIFKPAAVTPVGDSFADVDESVWFNAREPLAQTFDVGDGRLITVIGNHLKSKSPPTGAGAEPADGQGFFNADRVAQANSIVDFVQSIVDDPAKSDDVILLGDFNAYSQEDPIQALTASGLTDLLATEDPDSHTYSFNGQVGSLDHALVTPSLKKSITGIGEWSINAPEWSDRGYAFGATEPGTPWRASDHDPLVVGLTKAAPPIDIDVVTFNDFHGRIEAAPPAAGAAVLGGLFDKYRAANPNTIVASAGDSVGASTFTSFVANDQPTIDALNAAGVDVTALGNHEFDQGRADVDDRLATAFGFPLISANLYEKGTDEHAFDPYFIKTVEDGVRVGFIGATTEDLPTLVSPAGIATLDVRPIVDSVTSIADDLRDGDESNGEADVVILIQHEGPENGDLAAATGDSVFGKIVAGVGTDVDAIVAGHTHQLFDHDVPVPGTDTTIPVIEAAKYGEAYGHLAITVDPVTHDLISIDGEVLPLVGAADPDPEIAAIVAKAVADAAPLGARPLGTITEDLKRARQNDGSENRGGESTLSNLIADVQLEATTDLGAQVGIMNPGGVRTDLLYASSGEGDPAGNVSYKEAATVQPFANTLVTLDVTGAQLKGVLEQQWQPGTSRPFLKLGVSAGLKYAYDPAAAQGSRIGAIYLDGALVTPDQTIKIVTNSFLAAGGDGFTVLAQGANTRDSGQIDLQAFVDYLAANSPVAPDYAQRSVGVTLSAPAAAEGYAPGEQVTVALSSMLFSNGGVTTGDATVSLGGAVLGTAPLGFTIVDATDEQGSATVTVTIPEGVSGAQALTVAGPGGTTIDVPITVTEPAPPTEPVATTTIATPSRFLVFGNQKVTYKVTVAAEDASAPIGTVTVYDNGRKLTTADLAVDANGAVSITLPKLKRGIHLLTAHFAGEGYESSRSRLSLVIAI